jgi:AraC-like DNA-binding protein
VADGTEGEGGAGGEQRDGEKEDVVVAGDGEEGRRKVGLALRIVRERAEKGEVIGLAELGKEVGLSKWHLLRVFRRRWGVSPRVMGEGVVAETRKRNRLLEAEGGAAAGSRLDGGNGGSGSSEATILEGGPATTPTLTGGGVSVADWETFEAENFDLGGYADMDGVPELWDGEQDVLRELFPEVYQHEDLPES